METANYVLPDSSIYDSLEALDDYLSQVRLRRERRRETRIEYERLCTSIAKVREELEAAERDDDAEIILELKDVLQEFDRRMKVLRPPVLQPNLYVASATMTAQVVTEAPPVAERPSGTEFKPDIPAPLVSAVIATKDELQKEPIAPVALAPAPLLHEVISDRERNDAEQIAEIEAQKQAWLAEIEAITMRWNELDQEGLRQDKQMNRPACLRTRALACSLARIQTQADLAGLHSYVIGPVTTLRDRMEMARVYAGDKSEAPPFDPTFWSGNTERLTVEAWNELAYLYEEVAIAQEAWDWYAQIREEQGGGGHLALLNAIGAIQQMLFRTLDEYGGSDRLQGDLYGSLREAAGTVGFLSSLNAGTPWTELEAMALDVPRLYAQAQREAVTAHEKREKEARKAAALEAVLHWQQDNSSQPISAEFVARSREQLLPLLDACMAAGIPATNVQVRGAILQVAPMLLNGLPKYGKFLEAVLAERKRKGLDAVATAEPESLEEEDLPDSQIIGSIEWVSMLTEGQKVLILGGSSRPQVAERLKQRLRCASAEWLDSKKGDRMNKFKMDIARADIVVVVKKFASHEMTEKGRDWAKEYGKMFVLLPSGYGVNQIIYQMFLQLVSPDVSRKGDVPAPKPGASFGNLNLISG